MQEDVGSTRRRDGGMVRSRAGLIEAHTSCGSRDSRRGNAARTSWRLWSCSSSALDLTPMRMARRSSVHMMAWAVGEVCSPSAAINKSMLLSYLLGSALCSSRK